jgi:hypothetical protein
MSESVILCEGFHDRAFWKGWLTHLGCADPGLPPAGKTARAPILDPRNTPVTGGQFAYHSKSGHFIRVRPCHGKSKVLPAARLRLGQRPSKQLLRLIINVDPDVRVAGATTATTGLQLQDLLQLVHSTFDPSATVNADGNIEVDGGATMVALIRWEVTDPPAPGLPDQQTLERLVSAALAAAYPPRAKAVQDWLNSRPACPAPDPKEHAWSYMAGWYAEHGCEDFYSNLWRDAAVVRELESRLRSAGAWQIADAGAG